MGFRVEIQPQAFDDLDAIAGYIAAQSSHAIAERWFNAIFEEIYTLSEMPARCAVANESAELGRDVRVLLHGRRNRMYKVYFVINGSSPSGGSVQVLHVRHWAKKPMSGDELG